MDISDRIVSGYVPLSIRDDDAEAPKEQSLLSRVLVFPRRPRGDYFWLQTSVWGKAAATLCVLFFVWKEQGDNGTPTQTPLLSPSVQGDDISLDITVTGDPINIWSSIDTLHRCKEIDVPDIPTRAYRDPNTNTIHMIQGSTSFHKMTGPSLFDVKRDCDAAWNKTANPDPSMFAANEFLDSTFVFVENGTVLALAHTEYPGNRYDNCPGPIYPYCWTVTLGLMVSYDWGNTWQHARPPPHHLVAAVPYQYNHSALANGWGDPTNILKHDGHYYVAAWNRHPIGLQSPGVCMMRTNNIMDPSSWKGWNGADYAVSFASPYHPDEDWNPAEHICTVLEVDLLDPTQCNPFGLVYSQPLEVFLMTWNCMSGKQQFFMTTSTDLIHWSTPQPFYNEDMLPNATRHNVTSLQYPNLMDATAPQQFQDNNYGIIGANPHLFWVSLGHNVYVDGRSAWATPLKIQRKEVMEDVMEE